MNTPTSKKSITDSPWYWVYLFCTAGAIALVLAGPKFAVRQAQIERNLEARQVAAQYAADGSATVESSTSDQASGTRVTLVPLYVLLGVALSVAWFQLWRHHKRQSTQTIATTTAGEATA